MKSLLQIAVEIADKAHEGQFRRDGITPYITHPTTVLALFNKNYLDYLNNPSPVLGGLTSFIPRELEGIRPIFARITDKNYYELPNRNLSKNDLIEIIRALAVLHDVVEDNPKFTLDYINNQLIKNNIAKAIRDALLNSLNLITKPENAIYLNYILWCKNDLAARIIKIFDVTHNISTLNAAKKSDRIKIEKYELARHILLN